MNSAHPINSINSEVEQDYDELIRGMQEALEWAKGERTLVETVRSTDDAFYTLAQVALDPDVAAVFPDAKAVNDALRRLIESEKKKVPVAL